MKFVCILSTYTNEQRRRKVKLENLAEKGKIVSCGCRVYERFSYLSAFVKGAAGNGKRALECVAVL